MPIGLLRFVATGNLTPCFRMLNLFSSQLLSALVSSSHLISALLSALSNHLTLSSGPKPAPKTDLGAKASNPYALHREVFTHSKLLHREACTRRSFYTELGKFLFTASFYTKQAFVHSKFLPRKSCTHGSLYTEKLLHTASFDTKKFLH